MAKMSESQEEVITKFSIVVPTYNRAYQLLETLNSLLEIQYPRFEVIVVDDGSTDDTAEVLGKHFSGLVKVLKTTNCERGAARNLGASFATGLYLNFFDSDDLALKNHLQEAAMMTRYYPGCEWFHLGYSIVDFSSGSTLKRQIFEEGPHNNKLLRGNILGTNSVFIRRDIFLRHRFDEDRQLSGSEDYELWLRLASLYPLYGSPVITSNLIEHCSRSVNTIDAASLLVRTRACIEKVSSSKDVLLFYGARINQIYMIIELYTSLHLSLIRNQNYLALKHLIRSFNYSPKIVFRASFYVTLKNIITNGLFRKN